MKLVKKIISSVCALGMIATMTSAMVVHAATAPTLQITCDNYDETAKTGTMSVKILNYDQSVDERPEDLFIGLIQFGIKLPNTVFDQSYYTTGKGGKFSTNVKMGSRFSSDVTGPKLANGVLAATFATNSTDAGKMLNSYNGDNISTVEFMTINFKLLDSVASVDVKDLLGDVMLENYHYDANWANKVATYTYGNMKGCAKMTYDLPVIGSVEPPTPDKPTVKDDGTILPIKPSDIGGTGDVFVGEDGSKAVAGLGNFVASGVINELNWTIKYTPVNGVETQATKSFVPAELKGVNVESKVTIGLIVNYNPAEYENVTIVSGALN